MIPKLKKILFATDLSAGAKQALNYAESIAKQYDGEVTVLHVVLDVAQELAAGPGAELISHFGAEKWNDMMKDRLHDADSIIRKHLDEWCQESSLDPKTCNIGGATIIIKVGRPVESIVKMTEEGEYDLVVLGSHGQGAWAELLLGSVAHGVLKRSTKPVLLVPVSVDDA